MNANTPAQLTPEAIGTPFEGGFYGGNIRAYDGTFAIVWAPKAQGDVKGLWLPKYDLVPGAMSCFDSMANTRAMAEAGSPIAQAALSATINGHTDWCVPARDVLEMGYRYLKPTTYGNSASFRDGDNASSIPVGYPYTETTPAQTSVQAFQKGAAEAFNDAWYWSSTQCSEFNAYLQFFYYGDQFNDFKEYEGRCRFVRLIQLSS